MIPNCSKYRKIRSLRHVNLLHVLPISFSILGAEPVNQTIFQNAHVRVQMKYQNNEGMYIDVPNKKIP